MTSRPQATSRLLTETDRTIVTRLAMGQSYARNVGVEHNVVHPNPHEFVPRKGVLKRMFVEVELKWRAQSFASTGAKAKNSGPVMSHRTVDGVLVAMIQAGAMSKWGGT